MGERERERKRGDRVRQGGREPQRNETGEDGQGWERTAGGFALRGTGPTTDNTGEYRREESAPYLEKDREKENEQRGTEH